MEYIIKYEIWSHIVNVVWKICFIYTWLFVTACHQNTEYTYPVNADSLNVMHTLFNFSAVQLLAPTHPQYWTFI